MCPISLPPHLKLVTTKDGSPSMKIQYDSVAEQMHSSHGAFEESKYIYLQALQRLHKLSLPVRILSVGLGLGYNEILSAGYCLQHGLKLRVQSYENEEFLVQSFQSWAQGTLTSAHPLFPTYESILELTSNFLKLDPHQLRLKITDLSLTGHINHLGALTTQGPFPRHCTLIYFDPFSNKTAPDFWTPEFIARFLHSCASSECILSTYAATGNLKRALQSQNFKVDLRPGFSKKRNSIFALRQSLRSEVETLVQKK